MPSDVIPWILIICLLITAGVLVFVLRRHRARAAAQLAEASTVHERVLADSLAAHQRELAATSAAQRSRERELALEVEGEKKRATALHNKLIKSEGWDAASAETIVRVCAELGLDAFVATNILFLCEDDKRAPYVAQLDHVVLTEQGCLVIENKRWSGVVIESRQPEAIHPSLGLLVSQGLPPHLRDGALAPPFAIHISATRAPQRNEKEQGNAREERKHDAPINVRFAAGRHAPVKQVRAQAVHLSTHLKNNGISAPFFTPCVYYSHPQAQVHVGSASDIGRPRTPIVTDSAGLRRLLGPYATPGRPTVRRETIDAIAAELAEIGASVRATGRFHANSPAEASTGS